MVESNKTCDRYNSYVVNNQTSFKISSKYEGIPQNLGINVFAYIVLICLFIFLRKKAWNYGKLAWINKPASLVPTLMHRDSQVERENVPGTEEKFVHTNQNLTFSQKIWRLIPMFIKISDDQLNRKCGADAVLYCQFQRSLMVTVAVMMCFSLVIIVPLNLYGGTLRSSSDFAALTIGNLEKNTSYLWGHFIVAFILMMFAFYVSNRFLNKVDIKISDEISSTIMIKNMPPEGCEELVIRKHFEEAFPSSKIKRVQVTHKVDKLIEIYADKMYMQEALDFCYEVIEKGGDRVMVVPHGCGRIMACVCCKMERWVPVDGVEYYSSEVIRLNDLFVKEKEKTVTECTLPIVFITFNSVQEALEVRRDYAYQDYCCINKGPPRTSSISDDLQSAHWKIAFAPSSQDILWQNLHKRGWRWWVPVILANLVVAFFVFVLSTPAVILKLIDEYQITQKLSKLKNPMLTQVAPSLILVVATALMPVLIVWSDKLSAHWTNTTQTKSVMNKLYAVLVITVLILPSLGLNSVSALFMWLFMIKTDSKVPDRFKWDCIFLPDGGAIFCNYLISASFIGTALELLRLGELILFSFQMCYSKSRAENQAIAQKILWEFPYGLGYAWTLALFTMVSAYAVVVPIITPFGLVYLILKHLVDRYNIVHVNMRSEVHDSVHANAAQLMQVGLVLTQATITIYVTLREDATNALPICCYLAFVLGLLLSLGRSTRRCILNLACVKYSPSRKENESIHINPGGDSSMDNKGFLSLSDLKNHLFMPFQLTMEKLVNIDDIIRRKSTVLSTEGSPGFSNPQNSSDPVQIEA